MVAFWEMIIFISTHIFAVPKYFHAQNDSNKQENKCFNSPSMVEHYMTCRRQKWSVKKKAANRKKVGNKYLFYYIPRNNS